MVDCTMFSLMSLFILHLTYSEYSFTKFGEASSESFLSS